MYRNRTELLQRYTDLALKQHIWTEKQAFLFQHLHTKAKNGFPLTGKEIEFLKNNENLLNRKLKRSKVDVNKIDAKWEHRLELKERRRLNRFIKGKRKGKLLYKMEPIVAKMAFENSKEAPLIGLLLAIEQLKLKANRS